MNVIDAASLSLSAFEPFGEAFLRPSENPLAETDAFSFWSDRARFEIGGEVEIGWCDVRDAGAANWFERHDQTPEILIPVDGAMALPVLTPKGDVEAFVVSPGEAVVIARGVWHSACVPVDADRVGYFVIFRRGTPSEDVIKTTVEPFRVTAGSRTEGGR